MNERQKRLIEVYEHLRQHFGIHTKSDFAKAIDYGRTSMSAALNGNEKYLTNNLFESICNTYKDVFNIDYLLNGIGNAKIAGAPFKRNRATEYSGSLFGSAGGYDVNLDGVWENPKTGKW